jgi:hypothetical protein
MFWLGQGDKAFLTKYLYKLNQSNTFFIYCLTANSF